MNRLPLLALGFCLMLGCNGSAPEGNNAPPDAPPSPPESTISPFDARLLEIAREYEEYGRIETHFRWGFAFCAPPQIADPAVRFSDSNDTSTHGEKLYSLYVKNVPADPSFLRNYVQDGKPNPVGQAVVKESWTAEVVKNATASRQDVVRKVKVRRNGKLVEEEDRFNPFASKDGKLYRAGEKSTLFIMVKVSPGTPGTDDGWVYGTVTADGKQVTSAGMVQNCMACHQGAPHDRLFGLARK